MPIYTKKGDRGETGLFDGRRVPKDDALIEAIGAVDELNATLGDLNLYSSSRNSALARNLKREEGRKIELIQKDLFSIGARLAGAEIKINLEKRVLEMEDEIDKMWKEMPPLSNFILPSGQIHLARTVCRRAERRICAVPIIHNTFPIILVYINRLSDYLFCLARWENFKNMVVDKEWRM